MTSKTLSHSNVKLKTHVHTPKEYDKTNCSKIKSLHENNQHNFHEALEADRITTFGKHRREISEVVSDELPSNQWLELILLLDPCS